MTNSTFGFLPFVRKGLAKNILLPDDPASFGTAPNERAEIIAKIKVDTPAAANSTVSKTISLVGPGDVLGISRDVILRNEPANYVFNFESNLLPFVEFYEEDFLWRYSPGKENAKNQVRPWLALIVLKDDEYTPGAPLGDGLPPFIQIMSSTPTAFENLFHPNVEHWAWGHVQMNDPAGQNPIQNLKQTIEKNPDAAVCRLMSSRQLEPDTEYTAFLIPAFETGRLAGLGLPTNVKSLLGSWNQAPQSSNSYPTPSQGAYPVYHQWRFGTSAMGDFESLARKLKPVELSEASGTRLLDVRHLGMGLETDAAAVPNPLYASDATKNGTIGLEGALYPAGSVYGPAQKATPSSSVNPTLQDVFTGKLKELLNLQTELQQNANTAANVYNLGTNDEDPVVLPPLYGQHHADQTKVASGSPLWFQEMNLDLRYRAAAGMGTQIVKEKQEQFMAIAWRQIGEVNAANEKIRKAQLAIQVSKAIYEKHLLGEVTSTTSTSADKFERVLKIASPTLKKIQTADAGIRSTVNGFLGLTAPASQLDKVSLKMTAATSAITSATVDSGFRKMTRNRSTKVRVADKNTNELKQGLEKSLDQSTIVTAAAPVSSPAGSQNQSQYTAAPAYSDSYNDPLLQAMTLANFPASGTSTQNWLQYNRSQFEDFYRTYDHYGTLDAMDNPVRKSLISQSQAHAFRMAVQNSMDPEVSVAGRVLSQIKLSGGNSFSKIKPILAYPEINLPMVNELVELSVQNLVPNIGDIPNNSVTLLESNDRFIESFMLGLNHEFNRELMWREYPTDSRGTPFRVFWDKKDDINPQKTEEDIAPIHTWNPGKALGTNSYYASQNIMVLCVRGDLLKKFPNALIYAQKAGFGPSKSSPRQLINPTDVSSAFAANGDYIAGNAFIKVPLFKIDLQPDVVMLGFELSKDEAVGIPDNYPNAADAGWFFVFRERPGNIRFGLDAPMSGTLPSLSGNWNDLSWSHLSTGGTAAKVITQNTTAPGLIQTPQTPSWNSDAAQNAVILFRDASLVAIHAGNMIHD